MRTVSQQNASAPRQPSVSQTAMAAVKPVSYMTTAGSKVELDYTTVKNYLVAGQSDKISDQEVVMFMQLCKYTGLNPFTRECYLVKFGSSPAQMITGKEAFTKRAQADPNFDGFSAGIAVIGADGEMVKREGTLMMPGEELIGGWARVYVKNYSHPICASVNFSEYNKGQSSWNQYPGTMIRKVALVQALREAFPNSVGGLYVAEEFGAEEPSESAPPIEVPNHKTGTDAKVRRSAKRPSPTVSEYEDDVIEADFTDSISDTDVPPEPDKTFPVSDDELENLFGEVSE